DLIERNKNYINSDHLIISIAAGISIEIFEYLFKGKTTPKIIRIMTNHLCLINEGAGVYSVNSKCQNADEKIVLKLMSPVGLIKKVEDKQMNVFTALSGSGPAFVYHFAESLIDASLKNGVDIVTARQYAIQVI